MRKNREQNHPAISLINRFAENFNVASHRDPKFEHLVAPIDSSSMHLDAHEAMWVLSVQVCINWHTRESLPLSPLLLLL